MPRHDTDASLSPSVQFIVSSLDDRIRSGQYPHGKWLPSERLLADEFSVCRPIIRQAIAELERRNRILRIPNHRPVVWNAKEADSAVTRCQEDGGAGDTDLKRKSVGLWISGNPADMGPVETTRCIAQTLSRESETMRLVIACPEGNTLGEVLRSEAAALQRMAEDPDIAGVILWYLGGDQNRSVLEQLRAAGKHIVFIDRKPPEGFEADYVGVQNEYAAAEAVRHLIGMGHRHMVHLTNRDRASSVQERLDGYRLALREAGLPFRPEYVITGPFIPEGQWDEEQYWKAVIAEMNQLAERPTAVFAVNDYAASRLMHFLLLQGVRVPEDVAVVGFDDSERWRSLSPFITSVSQPFDQIGREAMRLLWERVQRPGQSMCRHVYLPTQLIVRGSSQRQSETHRQNGIFGTKQ